MRLATPCIKDATLDLEAIWASSSLIHHCSILFWNRFSSSSERNKPTQTRTHPRQCKTISKMVEGFRFRESRRVRIQMEDFNIARVSSESQRHNPEPDSTPLSVPLQRLVRALQSKGNSISEHFLDSWFRPRSTVAHFKGPTACGEHVRPQIRVSEATDTACHNVAFDSLLQERPVRPGKACEWFLR